MDGLPGMPRALLAGQREKVEPIKKMVGPLAPKRYAYTQGMAMPQVLLIALLSFILGLLVAANAPGLLDRLRKGDAGLVRSMISHASS